MYWAVWCKDAENAGSLRADYSTAHSRHLDTSPLPLVMAGPLLSDDGEARIGSLLLFEADTRAAVQEKMKADPFSTSGIWKEITISAFKMSRESISSARSA